MNKKFLIGICLVILVVVIAIIGVFILLSEGENKNIVDDNSKAQTIINSEDKALIAYFSETGNTEKLANLIHEQVGADMFKIEPVTPYPNGEELFDYTKEEQDKDERPEIKGTVNIDDYDTIFIGYPIWWSDLPQILYTFLERYDFSGKNVYLFSTNGGSGLSGTVSTITDKLSSANVNSNAFKLYRENMEEAPGELETWLKEIGVIK